MRLWNMLLSGIGPAAAALLLVTASPVALEAEGGSPKAVIPSLIQDAGKVPFGEKISAEFKIMNRGDAVLHILSSKPG